MATITSLAQASTSTTGATKQWKAQPTIYKMTLDLAEAATAKGSALAAADVIECIRIPAGSVVEWAGFLILVASTGGSADQAVTLGDGVDPNRWVDTFDLDAAVAGDMGAIVIATSNPTQFAASDTVDLVITAATTVGTAGKILVFASIADVNDNEKVGLAQIGD